MRTSYSTRVFSVLALLATGLSVSACQSRTTLLRQAQANLAISQNEITEQQLTFGSVSGVTQAGDPEQAPGLKPGGAGRKGVEVSGA